MNFKIDLRNKETSITLKFFLKSYFIANFNFNFTLILIF